MCFIYCGVPECFDLSLEKVNYPAEVLDPQVPFEIAVSFEYEGGHREMQNKEEQTDGEDKTVYDFPTNAHNVIFEL